MKSVYISGAISGLPIDEAKRLFKEAEQELKDAYVNPIIINPFDVLPFHPVHTWEDYMVKDIEALIRGARSIYMLRNWGTSKGARVERAIAIELGYEIIYQPC